ALLGLVFADGALPADATAAGLADVQRATLASLVRAPAAWRYANIGVALRGIGLAPALTERAALAGWLGVDAAERAEDEDDEEGEGGGDDDDGDDDGVDVEAPEPELDELDRIGRFVACLDAQDWREARQWF